MQRLQALQYIASLRGAFPEVLQAIKTLQLAQEMLLFKGTYLNEIGKTGGANAHLTSACCQQNLSMRSAKALAATT